MKKTHNLAQIINEKAKELGADLVGISSVEDLKHSPSHKISEKISEFKGVGTEDAGVCKRGAVKWPEEAVSAIVIAVEHPYEKPEMDWWVTMGGSAGNTEGNRLLIKTVSKLSALLEKDYGIRCFKLPYHIEHGGIYMKDAAVLGGLGCIGKNNILVTPQYGSRLRLRVMLTDANLPSTGATDFYPCEDCSEPCRTVCPKNAFAEKIYSKKKIGFEELPGRTGVYNRLRCNSQMIINESESKEIFSENNQNNLKKPIKYCRECEIVCPIGSK